MATIATVRNVTRPLVPATQPETGLGYDAPVPADHLDVTVDRYGDGTVVQTVTIYFSDYAGLEAEYEAGASATLLGGAIDAEVAAADWPAEELSATQRTVIGYDIVEA